jgi:hypothetical protein
MVRGGSSETGWASVWQCQCDNDLWADYTPQESQDLDGMMITGLDSGYMTDQKWRNDIFVLNGSADELYAEMVGIVPEYSMFQYNTRSRKQRKIRIILVLTM